MAQDRATTHEPVPAPVEPAPAPTPGPGVQALEALIAQGVPEPAKVVAIDAYRGEHDALMAVLHRTLGNGYVQRVADEMRGLRLDLDRKELAAGDPGDPESGYFLASAAEKGARWRTSGGGFTGKVGQDGLDSTVRLDADDALHAEVGKDGEGTLGWERDGKTQAELYGGYKGADDWSLGVRRPWELGGGTLTTGFEHSVDKDGAFDGAVADWKSTDERRSLSTRLGVSDGQFAGELAGAYKSADGKFSLGGDLGLDGGDFSGALKAGYKLSDRDQLSTSLSHADDLTRFTLGGSHAYDGGKLTGGLELSDGPKGTSGALSAGWKFGASELDARYAHKPGSDLFHLGGSHSFGDRFKLMGSLDHELKDAGSQTSLSISEKYRGADLAHSLALTAGAGDRDYLGLTGAIDGRLGGGLYAGGFGSFQAESGKQVAGQLGASLTFTPTEKTALTLAGVVDQDGALETRLQYDVFKRKIESASDLADHKKDALLSLFLSYRTGGAGDGMLDGRFGAPQYDLSGDAGGGSLMAGFRLKF